MSSDEANVWLVRPPEVCDDEMRCLKATLDVIEIKRAESFRFESDRRAYVVAHGLRRVVLGDLLGVGAARLVLSKQGNGKPELNWPGDSDIHFSHSHTRELVAFAVADSPVGVDVECVVGSEPDFDLLEPYMMLPRVSERTADLGADPAIQFFFYWTAVEAFWKAAGRGLSAKNPRIICEKNSDGRFEVKSERAEGRRGGPPLASVTRVPAPEGCMVSIAQRYVRKALRKPALSLPAGSCLASKKDGFFQQTRRYKDSAFISIVSV